jgi:hypothetical protein
MSVSTIIIVSALTVLVVLLTRVGYRRLMWCQRAEETSLQTATEIYGELDVVDKVTYQGGLPDHPSETHMRLAFVDNAIILFNEYYKVCIPCSKIHDMDFFILRHVSKSPFKSVLIMGPWSAVFFRDKFRHMVTVNYTDIENLENNLLLEATDYTKFLRLQKAMKDHYRQYKNKNWESKERNFNERITESGG